MNDIKDFDNTAIILSNDTKRELYAVKTWNDF